MVVKLSHLLPATRIAVFPETDMFYPRDIPTSVTDGGSVVYYMPTAITATCLHTNQTPKQREKILLAMKESKFSLILLSPPDGSFSGKECQLEV